MQPVVNKSGRDNVGKVDRLYGMTVYLLNNGKATARELSQKFEVSVRTIQRDVESLCQAGMIILDFSFTGEMCS